MLTYESTSRFADAGGLRVHYHEAGDGPPLLAIHGGAPGAYGWGNLGRNLEDLSRTFRTIIVDLPGYGRSDKPDITTGRNEMYADTMVALIGKLGLGPAHVLGMATGGAVGIRMAVDHPGCLRKLILVSSAGGHANFSLRPTTTPQRAYYGGDGPTVAKMREYLEQVVYDHSLITDDVLRERYEASVDPEFMSRAPGPTAGDLWKRLDEVTAQTLIIWGRENRFQPFENAVFMLSRIKRAQLHVFGECGLWVPYERMTEFNTLVRNFLTQEN